MSVDSTDSVVSSSSSSRSLSPLYWVAIALAVVTGLIHLWLGVAWSKPPLLVGGIGFGVGIIAVLLDVRRDLFVKLGIPYTAGQVVLYAIGHFPNEYGIEGVVDKVVQVALVGVLVVLMRRS